MQLATQFLLVAKLSFRATARSLALLADQFCDFSLPTPCANTIETWLLRLGYYRLHGPLPAASDWAWLIDTTFVIGSHKVLVIAGCPLTQMPFGQRDLAPSDLYVLNVSVLSPKGSQTILPALHAAAERTGLPRPCTSDEGSDIARAIGQWQKERPQVAHLLDIAHIGANLLKKHWQADPRWQEFLQQLTQTNQKLRQTPLAYLLSPRPLDKGPDLSVAVLLRFARRVLCWLDRDLADAVGRERYGWLLSFREDLHRWSNEQQLVQKTARQVRRHGWTVQSQESLEKLWSEVPEEEANQKLVEPLRNFAEEMTGSVHVGERLAGSTEALESVYGHWKRMVESGPQMGVSGLVLAVSGSMRSLPGEENGQGYEQTPWKKVCRWIAKNVGPTLHKLRRQFYKDTKPEPA